MRVAAASLAALLLAALLPAGGAIAGEDPRPVIVPNPLSGENPFRPHVPRDPPRVGVPWTDARSGLRVVRATAEPGLRHEYSRYDPMNRDGTLVVLVHVPSGELRVHRADALPYDRPGSLVRAVRLEQPRWDPEAASVLWGLEGFRIVRLDVLTGEETVVKDFAADPRVRPLLAAEPDLYRVTTKDEGEPSRDFRWWALALQGSQEDYRLRHLLVWDRAEDRVTGLRPLRADEPIDWVGMSPLGRHVLVGALEGPGPLQGLTMADVALGRFHRLDAATGHADVGLDTEGREVVVMQDVATDFVDLLPLDERTRPVDREAADPYAGTNRTRLVRLFYDSTSPHGFRAGVHVSCNAPGWCVISSTLDAGVPERNWLDRAILLVRLDPSSPRVAVLATVDGSRGAYWEETQATLTNDGRAVLWASNFGRDVGKELPSLVRLDVPEAWRRALAAPK